MNVYPDEHLLNTYPDEVYPDESLCSWLIRMKVYPDESLSGRTKKFIRRRFIRMKVYPEKVYLDESLSG